MYTWATNMTADTDATDNTITGTEGIGTGITVTLAAGDEIVIQMGEIYIESSDASNAGMEIGLYDGATFYSAHAEDASATSNLLIMAPANGGSPDVMRHLGYTLRTFNEPIGAWSGGELIFGQRALNLSTSTKTFQLAFKKIEGTGCIILGSSNNARWAIGVRREI